MNYRNLFGALRRFLVAGEMDNIFGVIFADLVDRVFMPKLKRALPGAKADVSKKAKELARAQAEAVEEDDVEVEELAEELAVAIKRVKRLPELVKEWRSEVGKSREWNKKAMAIISDLVYRRGFGRQEVEELAAHLASKFYMDHRIKRSMEGFDPELGPEQFRKFWKNVIIRNGTEWWKSEIRRLKRMEREKEDRDAFGEPQYHGGEEEKDLWNMLERNVRQQVSGDLDGEIFERWLAGAKSGGAANINIRRDIVQPLADSFGVSVNTVDNHLKRLRKVIADSLEEYLGHSLSRTQKRKFKLASALAREVFASRMAAWVLGPVMVLRRRG